MNPFYLFLEPTTLIWPELFSWSTPVHLHDFSNDQRLKAEDYILINNKDIVK